MSNTVGVGILGTGFARKVQIPAFLACENVKIASIASATLANAEAAAKEFGVEHFTDDWRETVSRADVDLVCITTPPNMHREMVLAAIDNGKHILCEKPMAMNVAEGEEMTRAASSANILALIDHEMRFQPGRQLAWKMLRDGAVGKVRHVKYSFRAPHRGDPNVAWNWWSDINAGGGALGAINSHIIDSFRWILGTEISSVFCQLQSHIKQRPFGDEMREVTTDDEANMLMRFADSELTSDTTGLVSVSMVEQPEYVNRLEVFGTDGVLRLDHRGELFVATNGEISWTQIDVDLSDNIDGVVDTGFARAFRAFASKLVEAIRNGETKIEHAATFEDGLAVQRVLDASRASNSDGCVIRI